mmetsp:Transcript_32016/g.66846  ORF Transcript_32016/g.66846 Transcript_32016/m.66846 type:complete len:87 (-) Transcript_32016:179-439(-)
MLVFDKICVIYAKSVGRNSGYRQRGLAFLTKAETKFIFCEVLDGDNEYLNDFLDLASSSPYTQFAIVCQTSLGWYNVSSNRIKRTG